MDYILKGDPREVAKVIRENRIRVQRGVICFIPVEPETANVEVEEADDVENLDNGDNTDAPIIEGTETETEDAPDTDTKATEVEDVKEVDLDADEKTIPDTDTKEVPEADVKEAATEKKTTKRSKKSE